MTYVNGDSLNIPFSDNSFDLVFSVDMLEHIKKADRMKAIEEAIRVTNKTCIITFPY